MIEIAVAIMAARYVGWWWVVVYLVVCIVLGLGLVRYALGATGRSLGLAVADLRATSTDTVIAIAGADSAPAAPPAQTLLIVPAGLLIAVPGVITTIVGLVLWVPAVRRRTAARLERAARRLGPPGQGGAV